MLGRLILTSYTTCPKCDGEKVWEPNSIGGSWHPWDDGMWLNEADSCACPLTANEREQMETEAILSAIERMDSEP